MNGNRDTEFIPTYIEITKTDRQLSYYNIEYYILQYNIVRQSSRNTTRKCCVFACRLELILFDSYVGVRLGYN